MRARSETPVLIAGAGPAGLTAAITLARQGVACLVVERRTVPSTLPRATVVSTRSMELVRSWGLEDAVLAGGVDAEWLMWQCPSLAQAAGGSGIRVGYPTRDEAARLSPARPACVPQDHLEHVLLEHLRSLPAARVVRGREVVGVDQRPGGVRVRVRDTRSAAVRTVDARYVIAADGAHSAIRRALGIAMRGPDDLARSATVLFRAPLDAVVGPHRYGIYTLERDGDHEILLPAGPGDRWVLGTSWPHDPAAIGAWPHSAITARITAAAGVPDLPVRIERVGAFRFAAQIADRFRSGDVLLAGDAAHRVSPRGGTGMNTAIHDGFDLGWKLAWILRGWAGPELLGTYEPERRPVAEHNVTRSADPNGSRRTTDEELPYDLGGRVPHAWLPDGRSTLDLVGPGLTVLAAPGAAVAPPAASGPPAAVHRLDAATARALGILDGGTLVVRPDGAAAAGLVPAAQAVAA